MEIFRGGDDGVSGLVYGPNSTWLCADSFGRIYSTTNASRVWDHSDALDSPIMALSINPAGNECVIASQGNVHIRQFPDFTTSILDNAVRRTLDVTHVCYESNGRHIFVSSKEPDIIIYEKTSNKIEHKINSHELGVKNFSISPDSSFVAFVDESNTAYIVSLGSIRGPMGQQYFDSNEVARFGAVSTLQIIRNDNTAYRLAWHPLAPVLAIPSTSGAIMLIRAHNKASNVPLLAYGFSDAIWTENLLTGESFSELSHKNHDINLVSFSPNGRFLASSDLEGNVIIWDINLDDLRASNPIAVHSASPGEPLHDFSWSRDPQDNFLLATNLTSSCWIDNVINPTLGFPTPSGLNVPSNTHKGPTASTTESSKPITQSSTYKRLQKAGMTTSAMFTPSKPMSELAIDHKDEQHTADTASDIFEDGEDESKADVSDSIKQIKKQLASSKVSTSIPMKVRFRDDDDDDVISVTEEKTSDSTSTAAILKSMEALLNQSASNPSVSMPTIQEAFQPSSSKPDSLQRRYLVWNHVGNITTRVTDVGNRIEIKFSDSGGLNKQEAFADSEGFTKGCLSYEGAFFSTDAETKQSDNNPDFSESSHGSILHYRAFPGQRQLRDCNESFTYQLEGEENADAIAVGRGWAAVSTSYGYLRVFSSTGIQLSVVCLPGKVICMTGCFNHLAVFCHTTHGVVVNMYLIQTLATTLSVSPIQAIVCNFPIPLNHPATIVWTGFDVTTMALTYLDSNGLVIALMNVFGGKEHSWVPVLDLAKVKKSADYVYWPVLVKSSRLVHVLLNGETKPSVHPQPVVSTKQFSIPVIQVTEGKDRGAAANDRARTAILAALQLQHHFYSNDTASSALDEEEANRMSELTLEYEKESDKAVLKMMQEACRLQRVGHAIDLLQRLRQQISFEAAIKVANHFGMAKVADMADRMKQFRQELEERKVAAEQSWVPGEIPSQSVPEEMPSTYSDSVPTYDDYEEAYQPPSQDKHSHQFEKPKPHTAPVNPFAVKNFSSPISKKRSALEGIQEMKGTPSPKKPLLSRQNSFTQQAKLNKKIGKHIL